MLVSESHLSGVGSASDALIKFISSEGESFSSYFPEDTLVEEAKNRALEHFYPGVGGQGAQAGDRYKVVRVEDTRTLRDGLTLRQENVADQDELLLIERRIPDPGALWDVGAVRAPSPGAIAAATSSLPDPQASVRQPDLQALLSTHELTNELRKILISLIEAGARLAAGGRNYEATLARLTSALDERKRPNTGQSQIITPQDLASRLTSNDAPANCANESTHSESDAVNPFKRAECLQLFLDKFRAWRSKIVAVPDSEAMSTIQDLGFSEEAADTALRETGGNEPAAALWLVGERGSSIFELMDGLPDGAVLQSLLKQPVVQRGLLNTRMLLAFIAMIGQTGSANLWLNAPHGGPLLSQILRTYHAEKYCLAVNQYTAPTVEPRGPSTSRQ